MKREGSEGFVSQDDGLFERGLRLLAVWLLIFLITGCGAVKINTPMGPMTESAFVHLETVKTVATQNTAQAACFDAVKSIGGESLSAVVDPAIAAVNAMAKVAGINGCASGDSMRQAQIPVYVPQKSGFEIAADFGKSAMQFGIPGFVAVTQSNDNKEVALGAQDAGVRIAESADAREVGVLMAAARSGERIATAGFDASRDAARAASEAAQASALAQARAAEATAAAQAQAAQAQAEALANAPPTYQVNGDMVTGDGNRTRGSGDVTTTTTTTVTCTATGTGASATGSGGNGGATGPGGSTIPSGGDGSASNGCR